MIVLNDGPLDAAGIFNMVNKNASGSVVIHYGIVREKTGDRTTREMKVEKTDDTEKEMSGIAGEIKEKWPVDDVVLARRFGSVKVGELLAVVAVSSAHRQEAFKACSYGIDRLKEMKSISEREVNV